MSQKGYVLLFRGINVGGNKVVRMEALRKLLAELGFGNLATYIQSGNVVLTSDRDEVAIAAAVEQAFPTAFGFTSRPTVRSAEAWQRLIEGNPFTPEEGRQLHAVILDGTPAPEALKSLEALATTERLKLKDGVLYLYTPDGFGRSKVAEQLDRLLKVPLTARNWNTVLKLHQMLEALPGS